MGELENELQRGIDCLLEGGPRHRLKNGNYFLPGDVATTHVSANVVEDENTLHLFARTEEGSILYGTQYRKALLEPGSNGRGLALDQSYTLGRVVARMLSSARKLNTEEHEAYEIAMQGHVLAKPETSRRIE